MDNKSDEKISINPSNPKKYRVSLTSGEFVTFETPYQNTIDVVDFLTNEKFIAVWTINNEWEYILRKHIVKVKEVK